MSRREVLQPIAGKAYPNIRDFEPSAHSKRMAAFARVAGASRRIGVTTIDAAKAAKAMCVAMQGKVMVLPAGNYSSGRAEIWSEP